MRFSSALSSMLPPSQVSTVAVLAVFSVFSGWVCLSTGAASATLLSLSWATRVIAHRKSAKPTAIRVAFFVTFSFRLVHDPQPASYKEDRGILYAPVFRLAELLVGELE